MHDGTPMGVTHDSPLAGPPPFGRRQWLKTSAGGIALGVLGAPLQAALASPASSLNAPQPANAAPSLRPWLTRRAPALQAQTLDGHTRTLADFQGQALLINFWATWCAPCLVELPSLNAAYERYSQDGLHLITLNHGEMPARVRSFMAQQPIAGTVLLDRSMSQLNTWGTRSLPASFLLDKQHRPHSLAIGEIDWRSAPALMAIESALRR